MGAWPSLVYGDSLENCRAVKRSVGSNPTAPALLEKTMWTMEKVFKIIKETKFERKENEPNLPMLTRTCPFHEDKLLKVTKHGDLYRVKCDLYNAILKQPNPTFSGPVPSCIEGPTAATKELAIIYWNWNGKEKSEGYPLKCLPPYWGFEVKDDYGIKEYLSTSTKKAVKLPPTPCPLHGKRFMKIVGLGNDAYIVGCHLHLLGDIIFRSQHNSYYLPNEERPKLASCWMGPERYGMDEAVRAWNTMMRKKS